MSLTKLYTDYAVKFHRLTAEAGGAIYVDGIKTAQISSGAEDAVEGSDGSLYNTFGYRRAREPRATFATNDLKALLDLLPNFFAAIDSDGTHPGISIYGQQYVDGGGRSTANAHETTFDKGLLILRSVEMSHRGDAMASAELVGSSSDGLTSPAPFVETATLPSASAQTSALWTLGLVDLGSFNLLGVESVSIDFGVQERAESRESDHYATFATVEKVQPRITIRAAHIDITSDTGEDGVYVSSGAVIYAKKRTEGGAFSAGADSISFTLGKSLVSWRTISGSPKTVEVEVIPYHTEGGAASIAISTAATHP